MDELTESTKNFFRIFKILFFIVWSIGLVFILYVSLTATPYSRSVQVTDLEICDILYSTDGIPKSIKICGYIFNEEPETIVTLDIYLFHMPDKKSISFMSHQNDNDLFDEGFFSRDLSLNGTTGDYLLKVMLFRDIRVVPE